MHPNHGDARPEQHDGEHGRRADPGVAPAEAARRDLDDPHARGRRTAGRLAEAVVRRAQVGRRLDGVDRAVTVLQMSLVDGRAYPLFGFLFGYGIVQLAGRRGAMGLPVTADIELDPTVIQAGIIVRF